MLLDVVDGLGNEHGAPVECVLDGLEQLDKLAQRQHERLGHGLGEGHVQVHDGLYQVADVVRIEETLQAERGSVTGMNQIQVLTSSNNHGTSD